MINCCLLVDLWSHNLFLLFLLNNQIIKTDPRIFFFLFSSSNLCKNNIDKQLYKYIYILSSMSSTNLSRVIEEKRKNNIWEFFFLSLSIEIYLPNKNDQKHSSSILICVLHKKIIIAINFYLS